MFPYLTSKNSLIFNFVRYENFIIFERVILTEYIKPDEIKKLNRNYPLPGPG